METSTNVKKEPSQEPSQVNDAPFLSSSQRTEDHKLYRPFGGSWLLFGDDILLDDEEYTELRRLWFTIIEPKFPNASMSAGPFPLDENDKGVICVHTKDYRDPLDVITEAIKIRAVLGDGYIGTLLYKTYEAKRQNLYSANGDTNISMYTLEHDGSFYRRDPADGKLKQLFSSQGVRELIVLERLKTDMGLEKE